jgi:hypothetical protein
MSFDKRTGRQSRIWEYNINILDKCKKREWDLTPPEYDPVVLFRDDNDELSGCIRTEC